MSRINIKSIAWRNFRSYGDMTQVVEFSPEESDLILLYGPNGSGKSTFQDCLDFLFFKKVKGKKRTWSSMASLPNRYNGGSAWASVTFEKDGITYEIERNISPSKVSLKVDGVAHQAKSSAAVEKEIEQILGFDIYAFKTFISVNANDFKNFIYMSKKDKEKVLDKIFNLGILNNLGDIVKKFAKGTQQQIELINGKTEVYKSNLDTLKHNAQNQWELRKEKVGKELKEVEQQLKLLAKQVKSDQKEFEQSQQEKTVLDQLVQEKISQKSALESEIRALKQQLKVFEADKCPTCHQDITKEHKESIGGNIKKRGKKLIVDLKNVSTEYEEAVKNLNVVKRGYEELWQKLNETKSEGKNKKAKYDELKAEHLLEEPVQPQYDVEQIKAELEELEEEIVDLRRKFGVQQRLIGMLQEDGIKGQVISSLVPVLNSHLKEYLEMMSFRFQVEINNDFSATIYDNGEEIDPDQMSEGQDKIINIALMFSYLSIITSGGMVNLLFIDEIFSFIDIDNISLILVFLKQWISRYDVNVIVVNHQMPGDLVFDRTFRTEIDVYSQLIEETAA